jgi:hypothetical protein
MMPRAICFAGYVVAGAAGAKTGKRYDGRVAEWSNAPVLKTGKAQAFVGSNPTPSAR